MDEFNLLEVIQRKLGGNQAQASGQGTFEQDAEKMKSVCYVAADANAETTNQGFFNGNDIEHPSGLATAYHDLKGLSSTKVSEQPGIQGLRPNSRSRIKGAMLAGYWITDFGASNGYIPGTIAAQSDAGVQNVLNYLGGQWDEITSRQAQATSIPVRKDMKTAAIQAELKEIKNISKVSYMTWAETSENVLKKYGEFNLIQGRDCERDRQRVRVFFNLLKSMFKGTELEAFCDISQVSRRHPGLSATEAENGPLLWQDIKDDCTKGVSREI